MDSHIWVAGTLIASIALIILTIVKFKFHPFLALLLGRGVIDSIGFFHRQKNRHLAA
ncbi:DsdX permease [Serratia liquefaciens]|nr:DsdX permease [Serratia liquefaciens]